MDHPDDYQDEMERLSGHDVEEVLSGHRSDDPAARAAGAAADRLREALLVQPAPEIAERHLVAMRAAAGSHLGRGNDMGRKTRSRFATLGLAAALVLGAGIAGALTLPEQAAEEAKERTADIETPNAEGPGSQGQNGSIQSQTASEHGKAVSEAAQDDSLQGCEKGMAVSAVASSKAEDNRGNEPRDVDPCAANERSNAGGQGKSNAGGQGKSNAGGQGKSNAGGQGANAQPQQGQGAGSESGPRSGGPPASAGAPSDLPTPGQ